MNLNAISDIKHAYYINLQSRPDRKEHVENQMKIIGIKTERFEAVKLKNGALGCSMSHVKLLELAKSQNFPHILIVEDDILFTNPFVFINQMNKFLSNHSDFDVVLISGNNIPPYQYVDNSCIRINSCQTTTGYLVKNHYYDKLIENYKTGMTKLMKEPENHRLYAIDKYWFNLQKIDKWYLITPLTVTQRADYSDIEKRHTNYTHVMLDLDKTSFLKRQQEHEKNEFFKIKF